MPDFNDVVRKTIGEDLSGSEVLEPFGDKLSLILYERLYDYNSLPEVMQGKDGVVILYQYTKYQGHFCLLMKREDNKYEWFDSLGYQPDYELKYFPYDKEPQLSNLMRRYTSSGGVVNYNNYKFQRDTDGVSTCGRWCICRYAFKEMSLAEFTQFIKSADMKYDRLVTIMTLIIKH